MKTPARTILRSLLAPLALLWGLAVPARAGYDTTVIADGPAVFWPLADTGGASPGPVTIADSSGNSHPGTLTATVASFTEGQPSLLSTDASTSIAFFGAGITASTVPGPGTGDFTLEIWMETTDTIQSMCLIDYGGGTAKLVDSAGGAEFHCGANSVSAGSGLGNGLPHHLVGVRRSGQLHLYLDGTEIGTPVADATNIGTSAALEVGENGAATQYFRSGSLQKAAWYNTALSSARVLAHYAAGVGGGTSFTATPATVPTNHSGHITLTLAGTGTSWAGGSTTFAITNSTTGTTAATKIGQAITSTTAATLVITTGAGVGTFTISDGTNTQTVATANAALSLAGGPTSGNTGTTPTLTLTGTHTVWTQETAAGLFSVSGGTGASIGTPTVTTDTAATAVLTVGTMTGPLTITDTSTGATATFTATTGGTYDLTGSTPGIVGTYIQPEGGATTGTFFAQPALGSARNDGAIRFKATCTGLSLTLRQGGSTTPIRVSIDGVDQAVVTAPSGSGSFASCSLGSSFDGASEHTYLVSGGQAWYATTLTTTGGTLNTSALPDRKAIAFYGDSIFEGDGYVLDSTQSICHKVGVILNRQVWNWGFFGSNVSDNGANPTTSGVERTGVVTGQSPVPDVIMVLYGTNDANNSISDADFTADFAAMLSALRAGCPNSYIIVERLLRMTAGDTTRDHNSTIIASVVAGLADPKIFYCQGAWSMYPGTDTAGVNNIHPDGPRCTPIAAGIGADINQFVPQGTTTGGGGRRRIDGGPIGVLDGPRPDRWAILDTTRRRKAA